VNCAGTAEPGGSSILNATTKAWRELIDSHLTSTFETCRAVAPHMVERGRGAIVNTSSHAFTGIYGGTGYPAGKGGVTSLTLAIAAELKEHGIRANVVCPGARTRLSSGEEYERHIESLFERKLLDAATRHGSLHPGPPEYVAPLYAFLASDLAAGITGEIFAGAGGYLGRFPRPEARLLAWRDHESNPPRSLPEIAAHLRPA
jgi:NAD(P)-dependent dehydrogenase (short-subunit alcohol dehydrogenase family)